MTTTTDRATADQQGALRARVAILIPDQIRRQVLSAQAERELASLVEVVGPGRPDIRPAELPGLLEGATAALTGWGTPPLTEDLLDRCPDLRLVAHTAGSVRHLLPPDALDRGIRLSHAAAMIADAVAELTVLQALLFLRPLHEIDRAMKAGEPWGAVKDGYPARLLGNRTVGVVGTGRVGRAVIRLFRGFGCRVLAYDPYLTDADAADLGVEAVPLDDLCGGADIVTIHAPVLPETTGMIGRTQLARMRDGAILLNNARSPLVDEEALFGELRAGRLVAALDVFAEEPLPADSPVRGLPSVLLSPHLAGKTIDTYLRQGQAMVDEVGRFLRGEPLRFEVTAAMLPLIA